MPVVVTVSFRQVGKAYPFDPAGLELREGDPVLVHTSRGLQLGHVAAEAKQVPSSEAAPLRKVLRRATEEDLLQDQQNRENERTAFGVGQEKIASHGLPMKMIDVEYTHDGGRIIFHFYSEARVDFRALVRDLAAHFRTRIELHQVGVRDEAKILGGLGPCGRPLCCATFLNDFRPVGIKMAKEQGLSLNPLKISGICGRLMCCLGFEYDQYRQAKTRLLKPGAEVTLAAGRGKVIKVNLAQGTVIVALEEGRQIEALASEVSPDRGCPDGGCPGCPQ